MKNLGLVVVLLVPLYAGGQNVVFNPGFDMMPWDTGWTIETDTSFFGDNNCSYSAAAEVIAGTGKSLPNCCSLRTSAYAFNPNLYSGTAIASAMIYQTFDEITNCEVKAYVKYHIHGNGDCLNRDSVIVQLLIDNEWKTNWKVAWRHMGPSREDTLDTVWTEVCTTIVNATVSGIKICALSYSTVYCNCSVASGWVNFWIDDIYVGEVGVEESKELRVKSRELRALQNPFIVSTEIEGQETGDRIEIYDISGNLVENTNKSIIGKGLSPGVYFIRLKGCRPIKIIKIGRMR